MVFNRNTGLTKQAYKANRTKGTTLLSKPDVSADGQLVVFEFVHDYGNVNNQQTDILVYDHQTSEIETISVTDNGTSFGVNGGPTISANGQFMAFRSNASLVGRGRNSLHNIFVHDRHTNQSSAVSVSSSGGYGNQGSNYPTISANGRFVAFRSNSSDLVDQDKNNVADIFVHDRQTKQTRRISVASDGTESNADSFAPSISENGRFVAFASSVSNLVIGDANGASDIFIHELAPW